jgi:hypothetical protein
MMVSFSGVLIIKHSFNMQMPVKNEDRWTIFPPSRPSYLPLLRIPSGYQMPSLIVLSVLRPLTGPVAFTEWAIFITSLGCTILAFRLPTWQMLMAVGCFFVSRQTMTNLSRSASTRNGFSSLYASSGDLICRSLYSTLDSRTSFRLTMLTRFAGCLEDTSLSSNSSCWWLLV